MNYLPSKKFIFIILIAAFLGGGFWLVKTKQKKPETKNIYQKNETAGGAAGIASKNLKYAEKDSDNDGLKDWEEALWGTDPEKPDTDKDGAKDGDEIKLKRNPLAPAPNDELPKEAIAIAEQLQSENLTLTEKTGRDFFAQFLALKSQNLPKEQIQEDIINSLFANISVSPSLDVYKTSDIKISYDNSKENVKKYINSLGYVFKDFDAVTESELEIIKQSFDEEKDEIIPENFQKLGKNKSVYEGAALKLLALKTPLNYKNSHLELINNFNNTALAIGKMEKLTEDPALAMTGLEEYRRETEKAVDFLKNLKTRLEKDNITISSYEDGYVFVEYFAKLN
ncbi:MAG: hypothetical protein A2909_00045 [Candidatus Tagabacteria bacterium RIFCSPLOWO2_01_FULL_39_11]|uniref:Uncharacterized protein n=1 Tax=Candidatus Tagabacteria bacterium RIFCSPLOWO2_01_FULL_39_11 TaxID=1802295 RepID=A0A1G2LU40_9BACT|nr:MAG: hypothetical protein A2909_00045 [Candidatus Tagabacteria bacterium RIFCSPLOWO2_01_FULL_39_11]